ncbi:MAG: hypothetical protein A2V98_26530 [Planctomycetes bacterium RBG_16_64_12]|nr:MAG: hypothetical protein A2V98_26530 [Planctomycetes bacterium RBG_16_64_12]
MIAKIIEFSIRNRFVVILLSLAVVIWGVHAVIHRPVDAIPDLSENQVIVTVAASCGERYLSTPLFAGLSEPSVAAASGPSAVAPSAQGDGQTATANESAVL